MPHNSKPKPFGSLNGSLTFLALIIALVYSPGARADLKRCGNLLSPDPVPAYDGLPGYARRAVNYGRDHVGDWGLVREIRNREAQSLKSWRVASKEMFETLEREGRKSPNFESESRHAQFFENESAYWRQMREAALGDWGDPAHPVDPGR